MPLDKLVDDFKLIIKNNPIESVKIYEPQDLVGRQIEQKFYSKETKRNEWYRGVVQQYEEESNTFIIHYDGEETFCKFCLMADWAIGDLRIIA